MSSTNDDSFVSGKGAALVKEAVDRAGRDCSCVFLAKKGALHMET